MPEEGIRFPRIEVTDDSEWPSWCWEYNIYPLAEKSDL